MNTRKKYLSISIIAIVVLSYFLVNNYVDNTYRNRMPEVPDLDEMSNSFQKYIQNRNSKTQNKISTKNLGELGMVYHANNYFEEAKACYLLAIELDLNEWKWSYYLGCLQRELGDSEKAIQNFEVVLERQPNNYMAQYYIATANSQLGDVTKFEEVMKSLSVLDLDLFVLKDTKRTAYFALPVYAKLELAKFYASQGKVDSAQKLLKNLISTNISFGPAYKQLSVIYAEKGNEKLSKYYSDRSKDLVEYTSPMDIFMDNLCFYSRSETYLLKQIEDAIRSSNLEWALDLVGYSLKNVPESKYIMSKGVKLYLSMEMARKALPYVDMHLKAFHDDYKELTDVGKGLSNFGLKKEAKQYFLAAEKLKNEKPETKSRLAGMFFERLGMKEKAFELINELLKEHSNDPAVLGGAAALYIQSGDLENGNKYLSRLQKLDPKNPRIQVFNGIIAKNTGDVKAAVTYYEKAFKAIPDQQFVITFLAEYYKKNTMWIKLSDLYQRALDFSPNNPNLQVAYGSFLINCPEKSIQNPKQAREYSERAFVNYKSDVQVQVAAGQFLAMSYYQLNEKQEALYYIRKSIDIAKENGFSREYIAGLKQALR